MTRLKVLALAVIAACVAIQETASGQGGQTAQSGSRTSYVRSCSRSSRWRRICSRNQRGLDRVAALAAGWFERYLVDRSLNPQPSETAGLFSGLPWRDVDEKCRSLRSAAHTLHLT